MVSGYYDEGFLTIQHAVDMAITEYISGKDPSGESLMKTSFVFFIIIKWNLGIAYLFVKMW